MVFAFLRSMLLGRLRVDDRRGGTAFHALSFPCIKTAFEQYVVLSQAGY